MSVVYDLWINVFAKLVYQSIHGAHVNAEPYNLCFTAAIHAKCILLIARPLVFGIQFCAVARLV